MEGPGPREKHQEEQAGPNEAPPAKQHEHTADEQHEPRNESNGLGPGHGFALEEFCCNPHPQ